MIKKRKMQFLLLFFIFLSLENNSYGENLFLQQNNLSHQEKYVNAVKEYTTELQKNSQNADLYYELGQIYLMAGDDINASKALHEAKALYIEQKKSHELLKVDVALQTLTLREAINKISNTLDVHSEKINHLEVGVNGNSLKLKELFMENNFKKDQ